MGHRHDPTGGDDPYHQAAVTIDIDWAPDFMIDFVAARLIEHGVRATWFVTHHSPAVERLRERPELFELGVHPNFMAGSSHGDSPDAVLEHMATVVPDATSMRSHCLLQSTPILDLVAARGRLAIDVSLYLRHASGLHPVEHWSAGGRLIRLPFFWEDDLEMRHPRPQWQSTTLLEGPGIKIFDFHPVHVFLNSVTLEPYDRLKSIHMSEVSESQCRDLVTDGDGARSAFLGLLQELARRGASSRVDEIAQTWRGAIGAPGK